MSLLSVNVTPKQKKNKEKSSILSNLSLKWANIIAKCLEIKLLSQFEVPGGWTWAHIWVAHTYMQGTYRWATPIYASQIKIKAKFKSNKKIKTKMR